MRMQGKRRSPDSNGSSVVENGGVAKEEHDETEGDGKRHLLTIFDELDNFLTPFTPEIHRVRIPPAAGESREADGAFRSTEVDGGVTPNPTPCGANGLLGCDHPQQQLLLLKLSPQALKEPQENFVDAFEKLLEMKFGIMALRIRHGLDAWSLASQMVNPYEVLSFVAAASPLNRAYFKMWELIQTFQLVPSVPHSQRFLSAHLCEGPGGFIEAVLEYRARSATNFEENRTHRASCHLVPTKSSSPRAKDGHGTEVHRQSCPELATCRPSTLDNQNVDFSSNWSRRLDTSTARSRPATLDNGDDDLSTYRSSIANASGRINSPKSRLKDCRCSANEMSRALRTGDQPGATLSQNNGSDIFHMDVLDNSRGVDTEESEAISGSVAGSKACPCAAADSSTVLRAGDQPEPPLLSNNGTEPFQVDRLNDCRDLELEESEPFSDSGVGEEPREEQFLANECDKSLGAFGKTSMHYEDLWFGLTLAATQQCGPGGGSLPPVMEMKRLNKKVAGRNCSQGHLHFGADGSGDLTNPANVNAFVKDTLGLSGGQKMELITADGAFDVSEDFSSQEHSHLQLVFCEVVSALRLQAERGSFILKLFDCYTASTLAILFILSSLYRKVEIVRLRTTRICNSERYVVAEGFLGLSRPLENVLLKLNEEWSSASLRGEKVGLALSGGVFPDALLHAVMESNAAIAAVQIDGINRALQLADVIGERLPTPDSVRKRKRSTSMLRRKLQTHQRMQRNAVTLCQALSIPCRSRFVTKES